MSVREQAREAAKDSTIKFYGTGESNAALYKMAGADAASDVWEPLLREVLEQLPSIVHATANRLGCAGAYANVKRIERTIKEALGE